MRSVVLIAVAAALVAAPAAAKPGKWKSLFDGKSLKGWTPKVSGAAAGVNLDNSFTVGNRAIRVTYKGWDGFKGRFGHLAYNRPFSAYRLRLEYRFFGKTLPDVEDWQHSNSGVMLHGQSPWTMSRDQKFPVSLEAQFLGANRPQKQPTGNMCSTGTTIVIDGIRRPEHCIDSSSAVMPNDQWVKAEFEVKKDGSVTHFINGKPVFHYTDPEYDPAEPDAKRVIEAAGGVVDVRSGYIYLQSEGHPVEFRNIKIMELE